MTECVRIDGEWVPIEQAVPDLAAKAAAAAALIDAQGQTLIDHDVQFKVAGERADAQDKALSALAGRLGEQDTIIGALSERLTATEGALRLQVKALEDKVTEQGVWLAELDARVAALDPVNGPALGVDISGHQNATVTQAAVDDPANAFIIVKATEGQGGKNDTYAAQRAAAGAKFLGAYHFAWLNQDPIKEAANFLGYAALKPGDLAFLDVENWGTGLAPTPEMLATPWSQRLAFTLAWLDEVKAKSGATPLVYANWDWIKNLRTAATQAQWARLTAYPLWLAEWTNVAGKHSTVTSKDGSNPDSWPIVVHQYGVIDNLDRNYTPDLPALRRIAVP